MIDIKHITLGVVELCREVGSFMRTSRLEFSDTDVEEKGLHDLVSFVDREAETRLIVKLSKILPGSGFLAEESGARQGGQFRWVIDPLDGTTNFVHGLPLYSISIALQQEETTISGVVYEVGRDECFYAWKDGPAMLNNQIVAVSRTSSLQKSLIATGFPYSDFSRMTPYMGLFDDLMRATRGIRRLGSAAVDLAYVACGRFEVFYEYGLNPWDVAAGAFIVERAGGRLSDFSGDSEVVFGKEIIASNGLVHDHFLEVTSRYF
jgi:myo-inositol-1(or 4)-monophosphatase